MNKLFGVMLILIGFGASAAEPMTICEVVTNYEALADQEVTVRGEVINDFTHGEYLSDRECRWNLVLGARDDAPGHKEITRTLLDKMMGRFKGSAWATVTGRVKILKPGNIPSFVVVVDSFANVDIRSE